MCVGGGLQERQQDDPAAVARAAEGKPSVYRTSLVALEVARLFTTYRLEANTVV